MKLTKYTRVFKRQYNTEKWRATHPYKRVELLWQGKYSESQETRTAHASASCTFSPFLDQSGFFWKKSKQLVINSAQTDRKSAENWNKN